MVTNGSNADTGALIQGDSHLPAWRSTYGVGTVANYGTVTGGSCGGFAGRRRRSDERRRRRSTTALILTGVAVYGGAGTVTNFGTVAGGGSGVFLYAGGSVTNGRARDTTALISGGEGVFIDPNWSRQFGCNRNQLRHDHRP